MVVLVMVSLRKTWTMEDSRVIVKRQLHIGNYNNVIDHGMSAAKREISDLAYTHQRPEQQRRAVLNNPAC